MSAKVSGKVWELDIDPVEKLVLLALSDHADHDGNNVRPGNDLLCAKTGLTQPTVTAKIKKLVSDGVLVPQTSTTGRGNRREFSIEMEHLPRRQYFVDKDAKKVKAGHTISSGEKSKAAFTFAQEKVKADEVIKVKDGNGKVKADEIKVKDGEILHDKERAQIEPSIEPIEPSKGEPESTPFETVDFSAYEESSENIQAALRKIFPAIPLMSGIVGNLTMFVIGLKAPASYVLAWPTWFRTRYHGQPANHFKFGDTFAELAEEGLEPDSWLNGSLGARFVAGVSGYLTKKGAKSKPVSAMVAHQVIAIGHWLDDQVGFSDRQEWINQGFLPINFTKFWHQNFENYGKPKPESVMKYWKEFSESLPSGQETI